MVMRAYIVVPTEPGSSRDVARQIAGLPGVKTADACWGSRDVFAVAGANGSEELNKIVMDQIQRLVGARETSIHIALDYLLFVSSATRSTCDTGVDAGAA